MLKNFAKFAEWCGWPGTSYPGRTIDVDKVDLAYRKRLTRGWLETRVDYEDQTTN